MLINLVSGPRNISTALMYSFAQRSDTQVVDEPLYAHYLRISEVQHPGRKEIMEAQNPDGQAVLAQWKQNPQPHLFLKNMAHHLVGLDLAFMYQSFVQNVFLIRNPREVLASYSKVMKQAQLDDIGLVRQAELFQSLNQQGRPPIVIKGNDIRKAPAHMLQSLCKKLGLAFEPEMLGWEAGPRREDGVWAPYWYSRVHQSTGFAPYQGETRQEPLPAPLEEIAHAAMPYYHFLEEAVIESPQG